MKKKFAWIVALMLVMCASAVWACSSAPTYEVSADSLKIWLDRYDETDVALVKGDKDALTWTSADESVVTVEKGRLIAQGKGETTVTVKDKKNATTIEVTVRDSRIPPRLDFTAVSAYLDNATDLPQYVKYGAKTYDADLQYSVTVADPSVAEFADNRIKGLKLGSTEATLEAPYKGLTLKQTVTITVKMPLAVELAAEEAEIFNVTTKKGKYEIAADVTYLGEKVDVAPVWTIAEGAEYIALEGSTVSAVAEGTAVVKTAVEYKGQRAESSVRITVQPDYIPTEFLPSGEENIVWERTTETVGDRNGSEYAIMKYQPDDNIGQTDADGDHLYSQRVEEKMSGKLLTELYAAGIRYFAYDLYFNCTDPYLMVGCGAYTDWILSNTYFRSDYLTILSADHGEEPQVINCLQTNRWITMVYDIKALWMNSLNLDSKFFFFVNTYANGEYQYLCNPRYSLDESFIPSENIVRVEQDGYIQATEDEFDAMIPVQEADRLPAYGAYTGEIGGRNNVYRYEANTDAPLNNAMVAAASMGLSYDDAMYELKKLGSHITFDIYPETCTQIVFYLNYLGLTAKLEVGKSNTLIYDRWLTVIADGKIQNTVQAGKWQTVSIAYLDNYDENASNAAVMFAACNKNDVVYIDNVRYMPDGTFIPAQYAEEDIRPVLLSGASGATLERQLSGPYAWSYKYTNTSDNAADSVGFKTVEKDGAFFRNGYRYVRFDLLADAAVRSVTLKASAERNVTAYEKTIVMCETFTGADVFAADGRKVDKLEKDTWYTVYIPVYYASADTGSVDVSVRTGGGSADKPAAAYIRYLDFAYAVNGLYTRDFYDIGDLASVEYQTSGDFRGTWKYVNKTCGETEGPTKNWGESGVGFERVTQRSNERAESFFLNGYKWIQVDFLAAENVQSFAVRVSGATANTVATYWVKNIMIDKAIDASTINVVDKNGRRADRIATDEWYTLYIPVNYTSIPPTDSYVMVSLYTNGGSETAPAVMYLKDVEYLTQDPDIPAAVPIPYGSWVPGLVELSWDTDGSVLYTSADPTLDQSGFYLKDWYENKATLAAQYRYAKMEFSVGANTTSVSIRMKGDTVNSFSGEYWVQGIPVGVDMKTDDASAAFRDYVYLYASDGTTRVTKLERDTRYVIYMPVSATDNWNEIYANGGTEAAPATMNIYGVTYAGIRPGEETPIPYGIWYPQYGSLLSWDTDGSVLFTCYDPTLDEAGFYLKDWYENKATLAAQYRYARMEFSVGANTTSVSIRMKGDTVNSFDGEYWVQGIPVGVDMTTDDASAAFRDHVYLYAADGTTRVSKLERNTRYVIYMPVSAADNWNDIYANGGTATAPATMNIYGVMYVASLPTAE